jgi:hypothetical protein
VQFQDWNGDLIATWIGGLGDAVTVPEAPARPADKTYTYTFSGWDKPVVACAGNAVYIATYTPAYINYTVTFLNADNTTISTATYHYGDMVVEPAAPKVPATMNPDLIFQGWDQEIGPCIGNAVYKALFGSVSSSGDFDGDGVVTESDVIWLLWYTVDPENNPLNGNADYDGDGTVTEADVIWLLWHTVAPDIYPLK